MKKALFLLLLFAVLLLSGCNTKGGNADFTQKVLPAPDRDVYLIAGQSNMEWKMKNSNSTVEYLPETEEYQKLFAAIQPNWWKTTGGNKADTASDEKLFMAESPEQLRFKSDRTYAENSDTFLYFYYEAESFTWVNPTGPDTKLTAIAFLLPNRVESEENVKSCFMTLAGSDIGSSEGLFTYYFPPEIAASFWDFVRK